MIAIDTNILVRFLLSDDKKQSEKVYKFFKDTESKNDEIHVPILVIIELLWVIESVYEIERKDIINSLDQLILMPIFNFEHLSAIQEFVVDAKNNNYDLSDLLIAHTAPNSKCSFIITFDKKASKHDLFKLLK
ncbi:type II toxin-antitoxin system VapC family toxin [Lentisphaera marina]|uniref:PIN domain-containing protein n=1 Tax=Lentisphaera marina TaxID=1111041 RepID=UPI0023661A86|nr:type II toxin-antitoxin system VapC family toxin [Lentisphaera marina]MDD7986914.1 type II toxin-antitoxin system VapC family toxin [Lentisphaera marina]